MSRRHIFEQKQAWPAPRLHHRPTAFDPRMAHDHHPGFRLVKVSKSNYSVS
jgi:hypothetical protein